MVENNTKVSSTLRCVFDDLRTWIYIFPNTMVRLPRTLPNLELLLAHCRSQKRKQWQTIFWPFFLLLVWLLSNNIEILHKGIYSEFNLKYEDMYNRRYQVPCLDVELDVVLFCMLSTLSNAAAIASFIPTGLSKSDLGLLGNITAGRFLSRRRLIITASVFKFQYARSTKGTTKEMRITVKFLYQIT